MQTETYPIENVEFIGKREGKSNVEMEPCSKCKYGVWKHRYYYWNHDTLRIEMVGGGCRRKYYDKVTQFKPDPRMIEKSSGGGDRTRFENISMSDLSRRKVTAYRICEEQGRSLDWASYCSYCRLKTARWDRVACSVCYAKKKQGLPVFNLKKSLFSKNT